MSELSALRARLKDRQVKEGALGTVEASVCLDQGLVTELREMEAERVRLVAEGRQLVGDPNSLVGARTVEADTSDLDAAIDAKGEEVKAETLWLKFRAVSSVRYQEIVNQFEDPEANRPEFMNDLCEAGLVEVLNGADRVGGEGVTDGLRWAEVHPELSHGEWDAIVTKVFLLNKRVPDAPFSRKPSKTTQR